MMNASDVSNIQRAAQIVADMSRQLRAASPSQRVDVITRHFVALSRCDINDRTMLITLLAIAAEQVRGIADADRLDVLLELASPAVAALTGTELVAHVGRALVGCVADGHGRVSVASARARQIRRYIEAHYTEPLTLRSVAKAVGRERGYVATSFRRETGLTLHRYLTVVRIKRAGELILQGEKIEAVMLMVGYHSKKSFYRQFKLQTGGTPGAYRRMSEY